MSSLLKIGELAKKTGLSIRTLHYYDEIGLLSPSHHTEAGHRLYGAEEINRLQQVLSLRQLGLSLREIHDCLDSPEFSLPQVIDLHRARIQAQMALSRTLLGRLNAIAQELETTQTVAVENLIAAMESITMSGQYLTAEQQDVLETRFQECETEWQDLLQEVRTEMERGTDFNSPTVRYLARRWMSGMKSFVQGDRDIYQALTYMYQQDALAMAGTIDAATFEYMMKAVACLALAEATDALIPPDTLFSPETLNCLRLGEAAIRQINFDVLGTEGFLLGVLADPTNLAYSVLADAGVTFEQVQPLVAKWLGVRPAMPEGWHPERLPYALRAKRVIELSLERAEQMGRSQIEPVDLLLGILDEAKESGGLATYILNTELGINLTQLEQQLVAIIEMSPG